MNRDLGFLALGLLTAATGWAQPIGFDPEYGNGQAKTLVLNDGEIVYLEKGEGVPVVFYNPLPDYRYWQWQVDAVSTSYHAVAVNFPASAIDRTPEGLAAALEALDLGPVHLVSHSSALWAVIPLAAERPDLFRSLVLEEPAAALTGAGPPVCSLTDVSEAEIEACQFSSLVSGPGWFEAWPAELRRYLGEVREMAAASTPSDLPPDFDPQDIKFPSTCDDELRNAMARHAIPILFIRGEQTPGFFQAALDEYEACLPPHASVTISGASHFVHLDQPAEYNRAIMDFFDGLPGR